MLNDKRIRIRIQDPQHWYVDVGTVPLFSGAGPGGGQAVSREGEFDSLALQGRHLRHDLALRPHRIVPVTEMENISRGPKTFGGFCHYPGVDAEQQGCDTTEYRQIV